jgi:hypothetical protein
MSADNGIVSVRKLRLITARQAVPRRLPWTPVALFHRLLQVIARDSGPEDRSERDDNRHATKTAEHETAPRGQALVTGQSWAVNGGLDM